MDDPSEAFLAGIQLLPAVHLFFISASFSFLMSPPNLGILSSFLQPEHSWALLYPLTLSRTKGICSDHTRILFLSVFAPYTSPNHRLVVLEREGQTLIWDLSPERTETQLS